jgi:hypothetical protein
MATSSMRSGLSATPRREYQILLACAATPLESERNERVRSLVEGDVDWEYLVWAASGHGLLSLLYRQLAPLASAESAGIPQQPLDDLRFLHERNRQRAVLLRDELHGLLPLFDDAGIVAVPLKGPTLSILAHGDIATREFQDLDILIRRKDLHRTRELLGRRGFFPEQQLPDGTEETRLRSCRVQTFVHHLTRIAVEVHWELTPPWFSYAFDNRSLWKRLVRLSLPGGMVWSFSKEDLLAYLCVHGTKHCWERLAWLWDVASLIRTNSDIDWERLLSDCKARGNERIVLLGLALASDLMDAGLPSMIEKEITAQRELAQAVAEIRRRLFGPYRPWPAALDEWLFHLQVTSRWRDRINYCLRRAGTLNERDWATAGIPGSFPVLDYAIRAGRVAGRLGRETKDWLLNGTAQPSIKTNV